MSNSKPVMLKIGTSDKTNKLLLFQINIILRHQTQMSTFCSTTSLIVTAHTPAVFRTSAGIFLFSELL